MPNAVGFVDDTSQLAHYELLAFIRTFCLAAGWSVVIQDVARKGFIDYYALILEA